MRRLLPRERAAIGFGLGALILAGFAATARSANAATQPNGSPYGPTPSTPGTTPTTPGTTTPGTPVTYGTFQGPVRGDPTIWRAQRELAALGYDPLGDDGIMGSRTRTALNDFQRDFGQPVTQSITPAAMDLLETEYARIAPPGALGDLGRARPTGGIRRF